MRNKKLYNAFRKKSDLLLNYQMCRAHLDDSLSVTRMAERILLKRRGLSYDHRKAIRKAVANSISTKSQTINVPEIGFNSTTSDILSRYVRNHFDEMVRVVKEEGLGKYPLKFRDIIERYE